MAIKSPLPFSVKNLTWSQRRSCLEKFFKFNSQDWEKIFSLDPSLNDLLIESAVGSFPLPIGIVWSLSVNHKLYHVPLATEEASVVAAANYAAKILREVSIITNEKSNLVLGQIYLKGDLESFTKFCSKNSHEFESLLKNHFASMEKRGGGYHSYRIRKVEDLETLGWEFLVDMRDSLGANSLNTALKKISEWLEKNSTYSVILSILSNDLSHVPFSASFRLPISNLLKLGYTQENLNKLIQISQLAQNDPLRAITHNKGIMNGVSALALATANDTRALEAAVHYYASVKGSYKGLSTYRIEKNLLIGHIETPLALAAIGGSVSIHPTSQWALSLMSIKSSSQLKSIAISLGLAQNLAALLALSSTGIQKGHMKLHNKREIFRRRDKF